MDPQNHLTVSMGEENHPQSGIDEILLGESSFSEKLIRSRENLHIVPAGNRLSEVERDIRGLKGGYLLDAKVKKLKSQDFVFIDCPPSAAVLSMNAILASKEIIVPVSSDFLALHGLSQLMVTLKHIKERLKHEMKIWVVLTRFHGRRRLAREVQEKLKNYFPNSVLATPIREAVALAESPSYGRTIFEHDENGNGANDYRSLAEDLLTARTLS